MARSLTLTVRRAPCVDRDGRNFGTRVQRIPVMVDPNLDHPGKSSRDAIWVRDLGDTAALMHELLHILLWDVGITEEDPHGHELVNDLEVALAPFVKFPIGESDG